MEIIDESLLTLYPEIGLEAFGWDPAELFADSHEKIAWQCKSGHIWVEKIINRTQLNLNCPKCSKET